MNHSYRLIRNAAGCNVPAPETAKGRGKGCQSIVVGTALATLAALSLGGTAHALPTGGEVSAGAGGIGQSGPVMTVTQSSQNLAINWQRFDIGSGETVNFVQPNRSAIALNRVLGTDGSQILGNLNANGQVFLINPNGVLFGQGARVDVGGLVASTLNLSDADFMAGKRTFAGHGGNVVNQGSLSAADGGSIALLGGRVSNEGTLVARLGTVALTAGERITLDFAGDTLLGVEVEQGALDALVENKNLIRADGGTVLMTAKGAEALLRSVVNNQGVIEARTLENHNGVIKLLAGMDAGTVNVGGTLDASAPTGGDGGFVETSAATVKIADDARITTLAANGKTGTWLIDPNDYTIAASGGDISGTTLSTGLDSSNITISTATQGTAGGNGDIFVNDTVSWSANQLTLTAERDININAELNGSGTAQLALEYGQGAVAAGNTANYRVNARVNLPAGQNFSTTLGSDGTTVNYTVINSLGDEGSTTTTDLQGMNGDIAGHYALGGDIDASDTSGWDTGAGFAPVGSDYSNRFTGSLDGLGHTLTGLFINRPAVNNVGLFGYVDGGKVKNIGLAGASVTGNWLVGALVGSNGGTIDNAWATGTVSGTDGVGGLAGYNGGSISNAWSSGTVSSANDIGGLVGRNNGSISYAYATGAVSGSGNQVGGLVGRNESGSISNAYATGAVNGSGSNVGGLVGYNAGTVSNSYWDSYSTGKGNAFGFDSGSTNINAVTSGPTQAAAANYAFRQSTYANLDFSGTGDWWMSEGNTRPFLRSEYSTVITNAHQLQLMAMNLGASYTLANDIDLSATLAAGGMWSSTGFAPVGKDWAMPFTGSFDGLGHTITGLVINRPAVHSVGLFGYVDGGEVKNIGLAGAGVTGDGSVGGLVGSNYGTIDNAWSSNGTVSGSDYYAGGLVGFNSGTVSNAWATGTVSGNWYVGGLVGSSSYGTISNAYAAATVGGNLDVGGLVGDNNSIISNSHYNIDSTFINGAHLVTLGGLYGDQYTSWFNGGLTPLDIGSYSSTLTAAGASTYTIGSLQGMKDLLAFADDATLTFHLAANVDLATAEGYNVPYLAANFDGDGHSLANLVVDLPNYAIGLFGQIASGTTVSNLGVIDAQVTGSTNVGGLAGINSGSISNVYVTGTVSGDGGVGGLAGINSGSISNAHATGAVSGSGDYVGGLVGWNAYSTISNAYATGAVSGAGNVGGLVGDSSNGSISNAYATGAVSGSSYVGGLVGNNGYNTISNSYWDSYSTGQSNAFGTTNGGTATNINAVTSDPAQSAAANYAFKQSAYANLDFTVTGDWWMSDGNTRPFLRSEYSTVITNAHQLQLMAMNLAANYTLASDIDLSAPLAVGGMWTGAGFVPVWEDWMMMPFTGSFDGLGHTITGLVINRPDAYSVGLFGYVDGGEVKNIGLAGANVTGNGSVGALVGENYGTIDNAWSSSGTVSGSDYYVGGLVGYNYGTVSNAWATGTVSGNGYVGGLVGGNDGTVSNAYAAATVSGNSNVGGLVGDNSYGTISNSHYNIDATTINGASGVTLGGLYNDQYTSWFNGGLTSLSIGNYSSTLTAAGASTYTIDSVQGMKDLLAFADDATFTFHLAANVDLATAEGYNVPYLAANFDGDGHTLANLVVDLPNAIGLFGQIASGTTVSNLGVIDAQVTGIYSVGGLAGFNEGSINNVYATGTVSGDHQVGGLVGYNEGSISNAYTTGTVSGTANDIGGLVGRNESGTISNAYATGAVTGSSSVGGLVGNNRNFSDISNAYATGTVNGNSVVGGLVGDNSYGSISNAYATGTVSGTYDIGGLVGYNNSYSTVSNSYWDTDTTGLSSSAGGGTGLNSIAMKQAVNYAGWDISTTGGSAAVWRIYEDHTAPLLKSFLTPLTVTANNDSKTYDGTTYSDGNGITCSTGACPGSNLFGALAYTGTSQNAVNAGDYAITPDGFWSSQQGYDISFVNGTLTIDKASLTIGGSFTVADKTYDGTTAAAITGNALTFNGIIGTDDVQAASWNASFADKNAGTGKTATLAATTFGGADGGNYSVDQSSAPTASANITPASLTVTANNASKTYNGLAYTGGNGVAYSGFVNSETSSVLGGALTYAGTSQGATSAGSYVIAPSGMTSGNYTIGFVDGTLTIDKAALTIGGSFTVADKAYDGTTAATITGNNLTFNGIVSGDDVQAASWSASFADQNAGTGKTATLAATTFGGLDGGNYNVDQSTAPTASADIIPASLTVTANDASKTYDGLAYAGGNDVVYSGFVNSETSSVLGGALSYAGTSQGATSAGSYSISPQGQISANYAISYVDGVLTVTPLDESAASSMSAPGYLGALHSAHLLAGGAPQSGAAPVIAMASYSFPSLQIIDSGISLPEDLSLLETQ